MFSMALISPATLSRTTGIRRFRRDVGSYAGERNDVSVHSTGNNGSLHEEEVGPRSGVRVPESPDS